MIRKAIRICGALASRLLAPASRIYSSIRRLLYSGWWSCRLDARDRDIKPYANSITGLRHIHLAPGCAIGKEAVISAWENFHGQSFTPCIEIGRGARLGDFIHITCINRISIGDGVLTGRWVTITDNSHGDNSAPQMRQAPDSRPLESRGPVTIGRNVWIGDKVTVLPGVSIGEGSIIGAGSVVTADIPPFCIAAGIPARVIREVG